MRVLWFTNTPSRYASYGGYNGGGWIYSLEEELSKKDNIELGISFFMNGQPEKVERNNVTYYPIANPFSGSFINRLYGFLSQSRKEAEWVKRFLKVIKDFKPDVIEVFGSEMSFGQVVQYTNIPVVLHIQGILTPYFNAYLPPFISKHNYIWKDCNPWNIFKRYIELRNFKRRGIREIDMIKHIRYFIGRTEWDKRITLIYNPLAKYYYGSEILRDVFYGIPCRTIPDKIKIISTLSAPLYKGYETVLKTAHLLKNEIGLSFEWRIYGNIDPKFVEQKIGIDHEDVHIRFMGVASADDLQKELSTATAYVHLSYIDNSPNSVCEAQLLGVPVVATNVGGIPSLIENDKTGFLVPANDPYQTAFVINSLATDKEMNLEIGNQARMVAIKRHDKKEIVKSLINTYNDILYEECNIK